MLRSAQHDSRCDSWNTSIIRQVQRRTVSRLETATGEEQKKRRHAYTGRDRSALQSRPTCHLPGGRKGNSYGEREL